MALFRRLLILGAAGAGAAWFLKKQQESGESEPEPQAAEATTDTPPAEDAGAGETSAVEPEGGEAQPTRVSNAVVPDTSSDPLVREQEDAAAAEAGSVGGEPETPPSGDDVGLAQDPAMKPVVEASGEEPETLEATDRDLGAGRERNG
jgi:hypothetical protein